MNKGAGEFAITRREQKNERKKKLSNAMQMESRKSKRKAHEYVNGLFALIIFIFIEWMRTSIHFNLESIKIKIIVLFSVQLSTPFPFPSSPSSVYFVMLWKVMVISLQFTSFKHAIFVRFLYLPNWSFPSHPFSLEEFQFIAVRSQSVVPFSFHFNVLVRSLSK